jgi:hypothetical protein
MAESRKTASKAGGAVLTLAAARQAKRRSSYGRHHVPGSAGRCQHHRVRHGQATPAATRAAAWAGPLEAQRVVSPGIAERTQYGALATSGQRPAAGSRRESLPRLNDSGTPVCTGPQRVRRKHRPAETADPCRPRFAQTGVMPCLRRENERSFPRAAAKRRIS